MEDALSALPDSVEVECGEETCQAFDINGYKELVTLSYDKLFFQQAHQILKKKTKLLQDKTDELIRDRILCEEALEISKSEYDRLLEKWKKDNKKLHEAEVKANSPWPWVMVGIGSAASVGGSLGVYYDKTNPWPYTVLGLGIVTGVIGLIDGLM